MIMDQRIAKLNERLDSAKLVCEELCSLEQAKCAFDQLEITMIHKNHRPNVQDHLFRFVIENGYRNLIIDLNKELADLVNLTPPPQPTCERSITLEK